MPFCAVSVTISAPFHAGNESFPSHVLGLAHVPDGAMRQGKDESSIPDNNLAEGIPASIQSLCCQIGFIGFHGAHRFGCHHITL